MLDWGLLLVWFVGRASDFLREGEHLWQGRCCCR